MTDRGRVTMRRLLDRRAVLSAIGGALAASKGSTPVDAGTVTTMDYCYWRKDSSYCSQGQRYEKWCYVCNDPGTGWETVRCESRLIGPC
ncbi:MAG: hypothetical protein WKF80_04880 [Thermomicrobiales bacterium]